MTHSLASTLREMYTPTTPVKKLMRGSEIRSFLERNIQPPATIIVTSIDRLPATFQRPLYMVVNEDDSSKPGSHWVGVYVAKNGDGLYLDSFGRPPLAEVDKFLLKHTRMFEISRIQLQMSTSILCGAFTSIALVEFSRDKTLKHFLSTFNPFNRYVNDLIITNMYENNCINKFSL